MAVMAPRRKASVGRRQIPGKGDQTRNRPAVFLALYFVLKVLVTLSRPTLCDPMDRRLLCLWDSPGKNTGEDCSRRYSQPRD